MHLPHAVQAIFLRRRLDREMRAEIQAHLDALTQANIEAGMAPADAAFAARRSFGNVDGIQEAARDTWAFRWVDDFLRDVRQGTRTLAKAPGFSAAVILTLALGIGVNTAIFSLVRGILVRPLALDDPDAIVVVRHVGAHFAGDHDFSGPDYLDVRAQNTTLAHIAAFSAEGAVLSGHGAPRFVFVAGATSNLLTTMGARARVGRIFSEQDAPAGGPLAVISHRLWSDHFGGDSSAVGHAITLNAKTFTLVGVMAAEFDYPTWIDVWITDPGQLPGMRVNEPAPYLATRDVFSLASVARLKPGVSLAEAQAELTTLVQALPSPQTGGRAIQLIPLKEAVVGNVEPMLLLLLGCVGAVLLIACLNVANLMIARATSRERDIGVRLALGAGRFRIVRQLLAESLVLAGIGGALGLWIGVWGRDVLLALMRATSTDVPRVTEVRFDSAVLLFALGASVFTGVLSGLLPALQGSRSDLVAFLRHGRGMTTGRRARALRSSLVSAEVALAIALLVSAGLLLRSLWNVQAVAWGVQSENIAMLRTALGAGQIETQEKRHAFYAQLLERLEHTPGFEAVGISTLPMGDTWNHLGFAPEGQPVEPTQMPQAGTHVISPGFFRTLSIPVVRGRGFTHEDRPETPFLAIVNESLARAFFPDGDAVGKRLHYAGWIPDTEIIGVVADVHHEGAEAAPGYQIYFSYDQGGFGTSLHLYIRTPLSLASTQAAVRRILADLDPDLPIIQADLLTTVLGQSGRRRGFPLALIASFGGLAVLLAALGVYAVTAFSVAQQTREIGIRLALGARASEVITHAMRGGFRPVAIGLGAGVLCGAALATTARNLLFGVGPLDPATFAVVALGVALLGLVACWWPARRATRVDPMIALRAD